MEEARKYRRYCYHGQYVPNIHMLHNIVLIPIVTSPLASSMFAPGINQIAESLDTTSQAVIACQTGFVIMLGIGP